MSRRTRRVQPEWSPRLNLRHPLASKLLIASNGYTDGSALWDAVSEQLIAATIVSGAPAPADTELGRGMSSHPANGIYWSAANLFTSAPFSMLVQYVRNDTNGQPESIFSWGNTATDGSPRISFIMDGNPWHIIVNNAYQFSGGTDFLGQRSTWALTHDGSNACIYQDGVQVSNTSVGFSSGNATNWYLGSGFSTFFPAVYLVHLQARDVWSAREVADLTANPHQVFAAGETALRSIPATAAVVAASVNIIGQAVL